MNELDLIIKRTLFEQEEKNVKIKLLKDVHEFELVKKFGSFKSEDLVEVPLWIAKFLVEKGFAKFSKEVKELDISDLQRILWKEKKDQKLSPLDYDFYQNLKQYIELLDEGDEEELMKVKTLTKDIIAVRLSKIMKLASRGENSKKMLENMTEEEKWLHKRIESTFTVWLNKIINF